MNLVETKTKKKPVVHQWTMARHDFAKSSARNTALRSFLLHAVI